MKIYGVGTDIVEIARIEKIITRFDKRFPERILSEQELTVFTNHKQQANYLAKRFAAKEAVVKALGVGFRDGITFADISVKNNTLGKPDLVFTGRVLEMVEKLGLQCHLSLSDEKKHALAFVVAEQH